MNLKFWTWFRKPKRQTQIAGLPSEEARAAAYLQAPEHPLFLAVLADLQEFSVEVSDRALDPDLSDGKLRWHTGGTDALLEFLEKLQQRERDARLTAEQLAAKQAEEKGTED